MVVRVCTIQKYKRMLAGFRRPSAAVEATKGERVQLRVKSRKRANRQYAACSQSVSHSLQLVSFSPTD